MDFIVDNWPMLLIGLGIVVVASGLIRRLAKLAFIGVGVIVLGLVVWPMVAGSL